MIGALRTTARPDETLLRRAIAAVPYPTPDVTLRHVGNATVGIATRPGFIDESISAPGDLIAALSGRLDNLSELLADASIAKHAPANPTSADVVVAAFRALGVDAVQRFRGAFAGVVTNGRDFWWFRDHVGFKPLFFRDTPEGIVAAGDARQIVVASELTEEPNLDVVEGMYVGGLPSSAPSALKDVRRLA